MITLSLVYDHRSRTPKGEEGPIEVRVTNNRKHYYIGTGVRVCKNRFAAGIIRDNATLPCPCFCYIGENDCTYFSDCYIPIRE